MLRNFIFNSTALLLAFLGSQLTDNNPLYAAEFFCSSGNVTCLIAAINQANQDDEEDTIDLEPGVYSLTAKDNVDINGATGLPVINTPITIRQSDLSATIERNPNAESFRIFRVSSTGRLSLFGLGLRNGLVEGDSHEGGGAILNRGTLLINQVSVYSNTTIAATEPSFKISGSAISNIAGQVTITASSICCNLARNGGSAAVLHNGGEMRVMESFVYDNISESSGGGGIVASNQTILEIDRTAVFGNEARGGNGGGFQGGGPLTITNSTIARNVTNSIGGGIHWRGGLHITNTTIAENRASALGGGIAITGGSPATLQNSILARNTTTFLFPDCWSSDSRSRLTSSGHNIIGDLSGCIADLHPSDFVGDPHLADWQFARFPLLPDSPAIDSGDTNACPVTDQLGTPRNGPCDIGAVEFYPVVNDLVTVASMATSLDPASVSGGPAGTFRSPPSSPTRAVGRS